MSRERKSSETPHSHYSEEQLTLFAELVRDAKCSPSIIYELTGVPIGSMKHLAESRKVEFAGAHTLGHKSGAMSSIRRARKLHLVRMKYGARINELFPPSIDTGGQ